MELAFQLTLADFDIFSEIETTEYVDNLFERDSAYGEPALEKFEELGDCVVTICVITWTRYLLDLVPMENLDAAWHQ